MSLRTKTPSYQEGLKELQGNLANMLPKEALAIFEEDATALEARHQDILKLSKGDLAPNFILNNAVGETIQLNNLLQEGKVVLVFYRGSWCPYCNLQLKQYQQVLDRMKDLGAQLVAISPQTPDESLNLKEKNELDFQVLSDPANLVARKYTSVFRNADKPVKAMADLGIDFNSYYSDDSQELPVPAVFIIEKNGKVSFARATGGDYRNRVEPSEIIDELAKS